MLCGPFLPGQADCQSDERAPSPATFRVMTYNIHHGEGLDGKVDLQRIAELVKREQADIVALQEVDKGVARTGRRDMPAELATLTGMRCLFSNNYAFQGGEYGNAILTRLPVEGWTNTPLPVLTQREQRGILQAVLRTGGSEIVVMNTHLDSSSETERLRSASEIQTLVQRYARQPNILCGDFNARPGSGTYKKIAESFTDSWPLAGTGEGNTIPAGKPRQRIDYVWLTQTNSLRPLRVWIPQSEASDHLPVIAELQLR